MKIDLDKFELYYLLESCFRGSHLRSDTILRFVDEVYPQLTENERESLYKWILRDFCDGSFEPDPTLSGADVIFMHRYNPDNQYRVTYAHDLKRLVKDAFLMNGKYYVNSRVYISPDAILNVERF